MSRGVRLLWKEESGGDISSVHDEQKASSIGCRNITVIAYPLALAAACHQPSWASLHQTTNVEYSLSATFQRQAHNTESP